MSRRHANRVISIRQSGRCRDQAQTPLAQCAPGELREPDRCWPRQYFAGQARSRAPGRCDAFQPHRAVRVRRQMRPARQSLGSAGGGSPASERTCKDEARHSMRPPRLRRTTRRPRRSSRSRNERNPRGMATVGRTRRRCRPTQDVRHADRGRRRRHPGEGPACTAPSGGLHPRDTLRSHHVQLMQGPRPREDPAETTAARAEPTCSPSRPHDPETGPDHRPNQPIEEHAK